MGNQQKLASASLENLYRIFTTPESPDSTLAKVDENISRNISAFLQEHIVAREKKLTKIEKDFSTPYIPETPSFVSEHTDHLLDKLVAQSVHTASPSFIGHMTTALPHFMLPLSRIMIALNQNLVKTETSRAFTPLERQVLGMLHQLVYQREDGFYAKWMHDSRHALGTCGSGGTIANLTALWVARNSAFPPDRKFAGIGQEGLYRALQHHGHDGAAIIVSRRGHYSIAKAAEVLGLGRKNVVLVNTDNNNRILPNAVISACKELRAHNIKVVSIVGVAGTTETGNVDPLNELADISQEYGAHFHVDAAWGGATLLSNKYRDLLAGIERADSVTIDAHKQLYVPMGVGMVLFKDAYALNAIEHHAQYVIRKGSKDLGSSTLEGSRPGMSMLVYSGLKIIGRQGYELLINRGIELARTFAALIEARPGFELISAPELNILTYRYIPAAARDELACAAEDRVATVNKVLNKFTKHIQKTQRAQGRTFVSRTQLYPRKYHKGAIIVFRVVLANPLTTEDILHEVLDEQEDIAINRATKLNNELAETLMQPDHRLAI
jgi:glutamate decarboxylase